MGVAFFETRTEPARSSPTEVSFGRFSLFPAQSLLLEGDKPVSLGSRALRDGRDGNRFIINIPGRGYKFVASVVAARHQTAPLALVSRKPPELVRLQAQTFSDSGARDIRAVQPSCALTS